MYNYVNEPFFIGTYNDSIYRGSSYDMTGYVWSDNNKRKEKKGIRKDRFIIKIMTVIATLFESVFGH